MACSAVRREGRLGKQKETMVSRTLPILSVGVLLLV